MMTIVLPRFWRGFILISSLTWASCVAYPSDRLAKACIGDEQEYDSHVFFVSVRIRAVAGHYCFFIVMEKKNQNEELRTRREFFKKAAQNALPILGAIVLATHPVFAKELPSTGCTTSCYNSCSGTCQGTCVSRCKEGCSGCGTQCQQGCASSCNGGCKYTCRGTSSKY